VFRIAEFEPFETLGYPSNNSALAKIGTSLFVGFYPTFLSFAAPEEQMEYVVLGHGAINVHINRHDLPQNTNGENNFTSLCVYRFHTTLGINQDDRSEFILADAHGKSYLYHICRYSD
jgi:hypothetical protein